MWFIVWFFFFSQNNLLYISCRLAQKNWQSDMEPKNLKKKSIFSRQLKAQLRFFEKNYVVVVQKILSIWFPAETERRKTGNGDNLTTKETLRWHRVVYHNYNYSSKWCFSNVYIHQKAYALFVDIIQNSYEHLLLANTVLKRGMFNFVHSINVDKKKKMKNRTKFFLTKIIRIFYSSWQVTSI